MEEAPLQEALSSYENSAPEDSSVGIYCASETVGKTETQGKSGRWPPSSESSAGRARAACEGLAGRGLNAGYVLEILYLDVFLRPHRTLTLCSMQHWGAIECYGVRE